MDYVAFGLGSQCVKDPLQQRCKKTEMTSIIYTFEPVSSLGEFIYS
jgi:hypothetical protein